MKIYPAIAVLLLLSLRSHSQTSSYHSGARSLAMGNASMTNSDTWSIFNNIGALADVGEMSVAMAYSSLYQMEGVRNVVIAANIPVKQFNVGSGIYYFGDEIYNEGKISFGASHKIEFVSLGVNVNYLQFNVLDFGTARSWVLEMGGKIQIHPSLHFGAHLFNINQACLSDRPHMRIPTVMKAGFSYRPTDTAMFNVEIEKDPEKKSSLRSGVEYELIKRILLRSGITTHPSSANVGIGFVAKKMNIDYALSHHNVLGLSHQLSAILKWTRKNENL